MRKGTILQLYGLRRTTGEVGIEIEMEGTGLALAHEAGTRMEGWVWDFKMDGSLRGESCEWVLGGPVPRELVTEVLAMLWKAREKAGAAFAPSRRCGVHVHMNVQQLTEQEVWNLIATYIAFEPLLIRWVGADREGNLFCLRASDARELIDTLVTARERGELQSMMNDYVRYASVNINSIKRYGSLEFRALGTPVQYAKIAQWVRMLYCVREFSLEMKNMKEFLYRLSADNARDVITQVFGPRSLLLRIDGADELLREGMRNLQDLLVTKGSAARNEQLIAGPGWHVYDDGDPDQIMRRWRAQQVLERPQPVDGFEFDDLPPLLDEDFDDEPDMEMDDEA